MILEPRQTLLNAHASTCYMEPRVRVQQGLEGPLDLRSSKSFPPVDKGAHAQLYTIAHTHNQKHSYEPS